MRLEYFEYLIEIARQKNMRLSSEYLHMTPQALSICVKNMEQEVGFPILERKPKGVELTADGELLLACAERIVNDYHETLRKIREDIKPKENKQLLIYTTPIINMCVGATLIERLQRDYPYVSVDIIDDPPQDMIERIQAQTELDVLALVTTNSDEILSEYLKTQLAVQYCFGDELVLAVAKNHDLARKGVIQLNDLKGENLIHCTSQKLEFTPSIKILEPIKNEIKNNYCNSVGMWGKLISSHIGVGLIMKRGLLQAFSEGYIDRSKVSMVKFSPKEKLECVCLYKKEAPIWLKQLVTEIAQL